MLCTHKTTILCQFGLIICHSPTYSFLHQFSTIFGGNCINLGELLLYSSSYRANRFCIFHLFLYDTLQKPPSTFLSRPRDSDFVGVLVHSICKLYRQVQVVKPTIVVFLLQLIKHSQNTGMQWRIPKHCPLFWCQLIAEVKCPSKSCICQCITLETIPFCLVGDTQLVCMSTLETNHLFIPQNVPAQPPCTH